MRARLGLIVTVILIGCGLVTSCSKDSAATTPTPATAPATTATTIPTSSAVTMSTGVFGVARSAACDTDLNLMETVVESYLALNGGSEVTETQLVQQGLLREESVLHDIGPGATVTPSPTGGCVS